jgi:16S rRNA (guanine527-N7)-methyltransferase
VSNRADDLDLTGAPQEPAELLRVGMERIGIEANPQRLEQLQRYLAEIELWNRRLKLVAAEGRELVVRHLLDSLAGWAAIRTELDARAELDDRADRQLRLADLGSGAGLPGIPIAVVEPEIKVDLVERSGRRVGFLRNAVAVSRVGNASVLQTEIEHYEGRPDIVVFRAFLPLTRVLFATLARIAGSRGLICAYKGRRDAVAEELHGLGGLPAKAARLVPVSVPFLRAERHLLVIAASHALE